MIRRSKLLPQAQQVQCSFSRLSSYHTFLNQKNSALKLSGSWYQTAKSSTVPSRTAYENTTNQMYADHLYKTRSIELDAVDMRVLTFPGSRILQLALHQTPEDCHLITRRRRKDILEYEIAAERKREQNRNVGSNVLSEVVLAKMRERLDNFETNSAVSFVFFGAKSLDLFSGGLFTGSFFDFLNYLI